DEVVMGENTMLMIHNPWTITWGNAKDLRKTAEDLDKVRDGCIIPAYKARCGDKLSDEKLIELLDNETFLTAAECLEYGLCDRVLTITKDEKKTEAENMVKEAMDHAKTGFMENFAERFGVMVAKAKKCEPVPKAAETPEDAAEKQHSVTKHLYDALGNVVAECEVPLGTPGKIALYADGEIIAEADEPDDTDINDGNMETESEPGKEDDTPEPAEDTKAKTNELFMKLIKGEM
ncbi:MAG: Clp protease ClpP, partial [Clostridiales bacterium]|nr:Clp protease ClpP [Clostridiales bacterium]